MPKGKPKFCHRGKHHLQWKNSVGGFFFLLEDFFSVGGEKSFCWRTGKIRWRTIPCESFFTPLEKRIILFSLVGERIIFSPLPAKGRIILPCPTANFSALPECDFFSSCRRAIFSSCWRADFFLLEGRNLFLIEGRKCFLLEVFVFMLEGIFFLPEATFFSCLRS